MFASNFEKTTKTTARRSFVEMQEVKARSGKHNKTIRKGGKRDYLEQDETGR
jgi:hypothetical protein